MSLFRLSFVLAVLPLKAAAPLSGEAMAVSRLLRVCHTGNSDNVVLLAQTLCHSSFSSLNNMRVTFSYHRQGWRLVLFRNSSPTPCYSASTESPNRQFDTRHDLPVIENALRLPKLPLTTP